MTKPYDIPHLPLPHDLETKAVLKQAIQANMRLAELKGSAREIPNEHILISTLTLQEARESSEIENIVTTQDDLYRAGLSLPKSIISAPTKEVLNYREAIQLGFEEVKRHQLLTTNTIVQIQHCLVGNSAGLRTQAGTTLRDQRGQVVYTPPQDPQLVRDYMSNLDRFINDPEACSMDPLIKMAIIHHQFESIHPFYDGNGRTGRIVNILYLVVNDLLDLPILYLSRYITIHKAQYYQLIQAIRDNAPDNHSDWEAWILFMLRGVEETAQETLMLVRGIARLMAEYKSTLRPLFGKQYKHELINNLFSHPYTKIDFMAEAMSVQRKTATKYLNMIVDAGLLEKVQKGRENYYINTSLVKLLTHDNFTTSDNDEIIESITE